MTPHRNWNLLTKKKQMNKNEFLYLFRDTAEKIEPKITEFTIINLSI